MISSDIELGLQSIVYISREKFIIDYPDLHKVHHSILKGHKKETHFNTRQTSIESLGAIKFRGNSNYHSLQAAFKAKRMNPDAINAPIDRDR